MKRKNLFQIPVSLLSTTLMDPGPRLCCIEMYVCMHLYQKEFTHRIWFIHDRQTLYLYTHLFYVWNVIVVYKKVSSYLNRNQLIFCRMCFTKVIRKPFFQWIVPMQSSVYITQIVYCQPTFFFGTFYTVHSIKHKLYQNVLMWINKSHQSDHKL